MIPDRASKARHNYANLFAWLVLAGYVMLPNTFTSLEASKDLSSSGKLVQNTVQNVQLSLFAGALCFIGIVGTCRLWHKWRKDPAWLLSQIFV